MDRQWARENADRDQRWQDQRAHDRTLFDLRERRTVYTNAIHAANRVMNAGADARLARRWAHEMQQRRDGQRLRQTSERAPSPDTAEAADLHTLVDKWDRSEDEYQRCVRDLWRATEESQLIGTREFSDLLKEVLSYVSATDIRTAADDEYEAFMKEAYALIAAASAQGMVDLGTL